jgi:hypothetical protein
MSRGREGFRQTPEKSFAPRDASGKAFLAFPSRVSIPSFFAMRAVGTCNVESPDPRGQIGASQP